jgi:hypothetical protein
MSRLVSYAAAARSGELICVSACGEVHVYLQDGRVAWATDSTHAFAFAAHLQDSAGIDAETFRQVVDECRRDKLSLGETLVSWGLASWDAVRDSLSHQIRLALTLLATVGDDDAQVLFLERAYRRYDEHLTFRIDEVLDRPTEPRELARDEAAPDEHEAALESPSRPCLARQLRASVEGLSWVEVIEDGRVVDGDPPAPSPRVPAGMLRTTILDGADFVAVRAARSSVVALRLASQRSLVCRVSADATFGAVVAAVVGTVAGAARPAKRPALRPDVAAWTLGTTASPTTMSIESFMQRAHEVLGAVVLAGDHVSVVAGSGSTALDRDACIDVARRRVGTFGNDPWLVGPEDREEDLASIGFYLRTLVSGEPQFWCFGAELDRENGTTLWMFADRGSSQGLGWACLAALTRALAAEPRRPRA